MNSSYLSLKQVSNTNYLSIEGAKKIFELSKFEWFDCIFNLFFYLREKIDLKHTRAISHYLISNIKIHA